MTDIDDNRDSDDLYGLDPNPSGALPRTLVFLLRHSRGVLLVTLALVLVAGYLASKLSLITDFAKLIPESSPSVIELAKSEPYLGNTSLLVVVIDVQGEGANERARAATTALSERLAADEAFNFVLHRFNREFFEDNALLYMGVDELEDLYRRLDARIRETILEENPLYVDFGDDDDDDDDAGAAADDDADKAAEAEPDILDPETFKRLYFADQLQQVEAREYLQNEDGTTYLVLAQPSRPPVDVAYNKRVLADVLGHAKALGLAERFGPNLEIRFSGNYWSATEENDAVKSDLAKAGLFSGVMLLIMVFWYFRRVRALWTIFVPLASGVVVMMGYVKLVVGHLNTVTGFCFALFMGLSIDFAIHLMARYDEERGRGQSVYDALLTTYRNTGKASLYAAATSAAGFMALLAADFRGFKEFGIIAGGGILICLGMIAVQMPAVIGVALRFTSEKRFAHYNAGHVVDQRRPRWALPTLILGVVFTGYCTYHALSVQWEDDFRNLRSASTENLEVAERVRLILGRSTQPAVRLADDIGEAARLTEACNAERDRRGDDATVQVCISIADFLPENQQAKLPIIGRIKALLTDNRLDSLPPDKAAHLRELRDQAPSRPLTEDDLPAEIRKSFISAEGRKYLMKAYPEVITWLASNNLRFTAELRAGDDVSDTDIGPIGTSMIMADLIRVMRRDSILVVLIALGLVFAILLLMFRSLPKALACFLPLLMGLACTLGMMQIVGWRLGLFNMIVLPSLIGLGVDNNIHLMHRYHVEGRGSWPYVVRTTGGACVMAAMTTLAGFGGLLLASHQGLRTIGELAVLGIIAATVIAVFVLPAAVSLHELVIRRSGFGLLPEHEFNGAE